jgi:dimeric dUTPase (all-alpha-NTP-PPase superfamily)
MGLKTHVYENISRGLHYVVSLSLLYEKGEVEIETTRVIHSSESIWRGRTQFNILLPESPLLI